MRIITSVLLALVGAGQAFAEPYSDPVGSWSAYSRTAQAITGDLNFDNGILRMSGGARFHYDATNSPGIFQIASPDDPSPVLLNQNKLCPEGARPGVMSLDQQGDRLSMKVFNQHANPESLDQNPEAFCGSFHYYRH